VKVGVVIEIGDEGRGVAPYAEIRDLALQAEASGLDSIWVYDHLLYRFHGQTTGIHEGWTVLAALAEATSRVTLGTLVACTGFRNPALLAKMAATLDHLSGGRLILGLGAGWHDPEFVAFGYPTDHKVGRFEEALELITGLIRTGHADLDGRWTTARDAVLEPPARPDLPILVAARGPRMLELTARHADAWNDAWFGQPDEQLGADRAALAEACRRVGRDPSTLAVTVGISVRYGEPDGATAPCLRGTPAEIARGLHAHADAGADHVVAALEPITQATLSEFAQAVALFRRPRELNARRA
jgi:alkanesulfonate monooxygenase SsuD/methylene tetrahydromethanopterin reductase-like flavin-dependent oxidoreductase (luciferase family)